MSIFGQKNFRNEIASLEGGKPGIVIQRALDVLPTLFFFTVHRIRKDSVRVALSGERVKAIQQQGCNRSGGPTGDLTAKGLSGGGYTYEYHGHQGPWRFPEAIRIRELEAAGRIYLPKKRNRHATA